MSRPAPSTTVVLGCRDDTFAQRLATSNHAPPPLGVPVTGEQVRDLIIGFWMSSHNHRKVLYRHLELMFPAATYFNWQLLMRLWYITATGNDVSPQDFTSIYGLTRLTQAVEPVIGLEPLTVCGAPTRTREEIYAAIERYRDVVARLGRTLAERYGFKYPAELEAVTRRKWDAFRAVVSTSAEHPAPPAIGHTDRSHGSSAPTPSHE